MLNIYFISILSRRYITPTIKPNASAVRLARHHINLMLFQVFYSKFLQIYIYPINYVEAASYQRIVVCGNLFRRTSNCSNLFFFSFSFVYQYISFYSSKSKAVACDTFHQAISSSFDEIVYGGYKMSTIDNVRAFQRSLVGNSMQTRVSSRHSASSFLFF